MARVIPISSGTADDPLASYRKKAALSRGRQDDTSADDLVRLASSTTPVYSDTAGMARLAAGALGGYLEGAEERKLDAQKAQLGEALLGIFGGPGQTGFGIGETPSARTSGPQPAASGAMADVAPNVYRDAIKGIESSGNYAALGPVTDKGDRAYGAYQVMGSNIPSWTKEALGRSLTPQQFLADAAAQDAVFDFHFGKALAKYGSPQDAASVWFTGRPLAQGAGASDQLGTSGSEYVRKFMAALRSGGGGQQSAVNMVSLPGQVASSDPSFVPPQAPAQQPWQTAQASPEEFERQLQIARGPSAGVPAAPTGEPAPIPPTSGVPLPPQRPPETYTPRAPLADRQMLAQALMSYGQPATQALAVNPNADNAGAIEFAASGMGRPAMTQASPQASVSPGPAPMQPQPQTAAYSLPSGPAGGAPQPSGDPRQAYFQQAMQSPLLTPAQKLQLAQSMQPQARYVDLGDAIGIMDQRGNVMGRIAKSSMPEYGVIGKDQFGNEQYGWRDRARQTVTPVQPGGQQQEPSDIPPAPPGTDPRVWREQMTKTKAAEIAPLSFSDEMAVRKELDSQPSIKKVREAWPIFNSMVKSAKSDVRAADIDFVYGVAKIFDPDSVVREGEQKLVIKSTQNLPEVVQSWLAQVTGGGGLSPSQRAEILEVSKNRISEYGADAYGQIEQYKAIVERRRGVADNVLPRLPKLLDREADEFIRANKKPEAPRVQVPDPFRGQPGGPARIQNDADYDRLPSGARFVGPDGQVRVKP